MLDEFNNCIHGDYITDDRSLDFCAYLSDTESNFRSNFSHHKCSMKKGVLRNFAKFNLCLSLFFNKVAGLRSASLLKKKLWHTCFPVNFAKFLRTHFYRTPLDDCFLFMQLNLISLMLLLANRFLLWKLEVTLS